MKKAGDVNEFLDETYKKKTLPIVVEKIPPRLNKSKIELAGKGVMNHLMEMGRKTDLSYEAMARKINETYNLDLTRDNICKFFHKNVAAITQLANDRKLLDKIRADLCLDHNAALSKDIKLFDKLIDELGDNDLIEPDAKAKAIGDLLDKKGRLLIRHARLAGKLSDNRGGIGHVDKMQVNVYGKDDEEKSDIIKRLKKAEFKDEINKTDIKKLPSSPK